MLKVYLQFSQFSSVSSLLFAYILLVLSQKPRTEKIYINFCFVFVKIYILFWKVLHFSRRYCWCEKQKWLRGLKESRIFREFAEHKAVTIKSKRLPWKKDDSHQEKSGTFIVCYMSNKFRSSKNQVCYTRK